MSNPYPGDPNNPSQPPAYGSQPYGGSQPPYGSQPVYGQPQQVLAVPVAQPKSGKAIASMILGFGIILPLCDIIIPFIGLLTIPTAVIGVILGHIALNDIKKSGGTLGGKGMAITGLVLGYISIGLLAVVILILLLVLGSLGAAVGGSSH